MIRQRKINTATQRPQPMHGNTAYPWTEHQEDVCDYMAGNASNSAQHTMGTPATAQAASQGADPASSHRITQLEAQLAKAQHTIQRLQANASGQASLTPGQRTAERTATLGRTIQEQIDRLTEEVGPPEPILPQVTEHEVVEIPGNTQPTSGAAASTQGPETSASTRPPTKRLRQATLTSKPAPAARQAGEIFNSPTQPSAWFTANYTGVHTESGIVRWFGGLKIPDKKKNEVRQYIETVMRQFPSISEEQRSNLDRHAVAQGIAVRAVANFADAPLPRPPKGSKKWNPLIIPYFPQCSNGFILGGFHFLDPLGGLGNETPFHNHGDVRMTIGESRYTDHAQGSFTLDTMDPADVRNFPSDHRRGGRRVKVHAQHCSLATGQSHTNSDFSPP